MHAHCTLTTSLYRVLYTGHGVRHKKQPPKKTYISRKRRNLNYSNLQILLPRNIAWYSESFIQKQKLSLSKLKSAILQLNTRYYHDCYTENANKINCVELIWKDEYPPNLSDLNPLEYARMGCKCNAWRVTILHAKADQHLQRWRTLCKRSELTCLKA